MHKANTKNKTNLISEFSNLLFFWVLAVLFFSLFRLSFILLYHSDINSSLKILEFIKGFFMGFRFDITVISYFLIVPLLSTYIFIPLNRINLVIKIRLLFQKIFVFSSVIISIITLSYYKEYKEQFNHFLFMGLYDDKKSVIQSIISDYNPVGNGIIIIVLIYLLLKTFSFFENKNKIYTFINSFKFKYRDLAFSILVLILFLGSIRASFTEFPVRRFYASVTSDDFINKTIINPFRSFSYAISDYKELNKSFGKNPFGPISSSITTKHKSVKEVLKKNTLSGSLQVKPKQVFLIVMESYDSWPLMNKYKDLNVSSRLRNIQNKGIRFVNFLPASNTTMNSFGSIITNIPYSGVNISKIGATKSFPSSIFNQFKTLGYQTNFFYGGYLSWQNIKNFVKKQGADNIFGAGSMNASMGIWGVDDEYLFNNVLKKVDTTKNSLNIILTMSYHSPYEVDIYSKGFQYKSVAELPKKLKSIYDKDKLPLKTLGHLWYADKALGDFVAKAENKYSNALFAFTGDHYGRKFINGSPTFYERSSVPFILYGKSVAENPKRILTPGSHIDIAPTLIELVAPPNHTYYSFGNSLLKKNTENAIGIGYNKAIDITKILEFSKNYGIKKQSINHNKLTNKNILRNKKKHDSLMSLAWYYITRGDSIN